MKQIFIILSVLIISCSMMTTRATAQSFDVKVNNITNWQYTIAYYDEAHTYIGGAGIGALSTVSITLTDTPIYCIVEIGLSGPPPGPGDRIRIGHPGYGYTPFGVSINTYPWFGGLPFKGDFYFIPGTSYGNVDIHL